MELDLHGCVRLQRYVKTRSQCCCFRLSTLKPCIHACIPSRVAAEDCRSPGLHIAPQPLIIISCRRRRCARERSPKRHALKQVACPYRFTISASPYRLTSGFGGFAATRDDKQPASPPLSLSPRLCRALCSLGVAVRQTAKRFESDTVSHKCNKECVPQVQQCTRGAATVQHKPERLLR